jgi:hypothetical protein
MKSKAATLRVQCTCTARTTGHRATCSLALVREAYLTPNQVNKNRISPKSACGCRSSTCGQQTSNAALLVTCSAPSAVHAACYQASARGAYLTPKHVDSNRSSLRNACGVRVELAWTPNQQHCTSSAPAVQPPQPTMPRACKHAHACMRACVRACVRA